MNRIKELRVAAKMSQAELGKKLGCVSQTVSKLELETRQLDPATIGALCDLFGCTSDYLLGRSDFRDPVVTNEDAQLLQTYHALPLEIRRAVDGLMTPYRQAAEQKTGS